MSADAPIDTLQRLVGAGPQLATDAWSLSDPTLEAVLAAVDGGARTIVECGSGRSTVIVARRLSELGAGTMHSLEHLAEWAEHTRGLLAAEGLGRAQVLTAPLEPHPLAGAAGGWYQRRSINRLPDGIDLLLIDGPPAGEPALHRSRHPALAELSGLLAPGATIVVDDAGRPGEADAIARWSDEYELEFTAGPGFASARWPLYVDLSSEARKLHRLE